MGSNPAPSAPQGNLFQVYVLEPLPDLQSQKLWGRPICDFAGDSGAMVATWAAQEHHVDTHLKSLVLGPLAEQFNKLFWGSPERGCFSKLPL